MIDLLSGIVAVFVSGVSIGVFDEGVIVTTTGSGASMNDNGKEVVGNWLAKGRGICKKKQLLCAA